MFPDPTKHEVCGHLTIIVDRPPVEVYQAIDAILKQAEAELSKLVQGRGLAKLLYTMQPSRGRD